MSKKAKTVVIAMSGGVDSSVAAALLVEEGYQVIGMMLRLWSQPCGEDSNRCCTPDAMAQARRVAAKLGIPFYAIDAQDQFYEHVVNYFLESYTSGQTPNPCMICNREIRWGLLLEHARALGADYLATGHYARLGQAPDGTFQLLRGLDEKKDQSYVLSGLTQDQLAHTLWPLGGFSKPQVREYARQLGLEVAERPDSQDLCFLGNLDYRQFLNAYRPQAASPGPILTTSGQEVGQHSGLPFYTIGQRKGLRIAAAEPLYVIKKDPQRNALIVGTEAEAGSFSLAAFPMNWIAGQPPASEFLAQVKIRYKSTAQSATIHIPDESDTALVQFHQPVKGITPGQFAVIYQDEIVLGSGMIHLNQD